LPPLLQFNNLATSFCTFLRFELQGRLVKRFSDFLPWSRVKTFAAYLVQLKKAGTYPNLFCCAGIAFTFTMPLKNKAV
jgi:hypothetical protein